MNEKVYDDLGNEIGEVDLSTRTLIMESTNQLGTSMIKVNVDLTNMNRSESDDEEIATERFNKINRFGYS